MGYTNMAEDGSGEAHNEEGRFVCEWTRLRNREKERQRVWKKGCDGKRTTQIIVITHINTHSIPTLSLSSSLSSITRRLFVFSVFSAFPLARQQEREQANHSPHQRLAVNESKREHEGEEREQSERWKSWKRKRMEEEEEEEGGWLLVRRGEEQRH